jgi:hypothetical protein
MVAAAAEARNARRMRVAFMKLSFESVTTTIVVCALTLIV